MEQQSSVERLARYLIIIGMLAIIGFLCWYFRSVLIYVILAFVVSLVSRPLVRLMQKIRIKGKCAPKWLLAIISIIAVLAVLILVVTQVIPVVTGIIREASFFSDMNLLDGSMADKINDWVISVIPSLGISMHSTFCSTI